MASSLKDGDLEASGHLIMAFFFTSFIVERKCFIGKSNRSQRVLPAAVFSFHHPSRSFFTSARTFAGLLEVSFRHFPLLEPSITAKLAFLSVEAYWILSGGLTQNDDKGVLSFFQRKHSWSFEVSLGDSPSTLKRHVKCAEVSSVTTS